MASENNANFAATIPDMATLTLGPSPGGLGTSKPTTPDEDMPSADSWYDEVVIDGKTVVVKDWFTELPKRIFDSHHQRNPTPYNALLLADSAGTGKSLTAMMATVKAAQLGSGPSLFVVTEGTLYQWQREFAKSFPGAISILVLDDPLTAANELTGYNVVLVTYEFVQNEYAKLQAYCEKRQKQEGLPRSKRKALKRPNLTVFSCGLHSGITGHLVLDDVTEIMDTNGKKFEAVHHLRHKFKFCIMLTSTPIYDSWLDLFAIMQFVQNHPIDTIEMMERTFAERGQDGKYTLQLNSPKYHRLHNFLVSFTIRNAESVVGTYPKTIEVVKFRAGEDAKQSNRSWEEYLTLVAEAKLDKDYDRAIERAPRLQGAATDQLATTKEERRYRARLETLRPNEEWLSPRIGAIISKFNELRDRDPKSSFLIFDESRFFLDIIQIAFEEMDDPVEVLRYDGTFTKERRDEILTQFNEGVSNVLLISCAVGNLGLNIQKADIIFECEPAWRVADEHHMEGRAARIGQTKKVKVFRFLAEDCTVDLYRIQHREAQDKQTAVIMNNLSAKSPGALPVIFSAMN